MQVQSSRSISSSVRGKQQEGHQHQGRVGRQRVNLGRRKGELGENRGAVRLDGEQLVREAEQLMGRGARPEEEEEDLDWVRRRMEEVQMSSPGENARPGGNQKETVRSRRNQGESVRNRGGNRGENAKVPGSELSRVLRGEGRRNSEPTSQVEGKGLARTVGKSSNGDCFN